MKEIKFKNNLPFIIGFIVMIILVAALGYFANVKLM